MPEADPDGKRGLDGTPVPAGVLFDARDEELSVPRMPKPQGSRTLRGERVAAATMAVGAGKVG
jgi:hypothetical protein